MGQFSEIFKRYIAAVFIGNLLLKLNVIDNVVGIGIVILIVILIIYLQKFKPKEGIYLLQLEFVIY